MKTNAISVLMGITFLCMIVSCDSTLVENENLDSLQEPTILTKASSLDPPIDLLNDLRDIPVHIYLPEGAAAVGRRYLSASSKDNGVLLVDNDSGSGRERWFLKRLNSDQVNENQFGIKVQGGAKHSYLTVMHDMRFLPTVPDVLYIYMGDDEISTYDNVATDWRIIPVDNKFLLQNRYKITSWLGTYNYGSEYANLNTGSEPVTNLLCRFAIEPIAEFVLNDVKYVPDNSSTNIRGEIDFLNSYPLVNNTNISATQTIQTMANYVEKSTFSETEGMSLQNTVKIDANFKIGVPSVVKIVDLSGSISYTNSTTKTYQVATGNEQSQTFTFTRTVSQEVPAHSSLYVWITGKKFTLNTKYVGHFYSKELGRTIRLNGDWSGQQYYEVKVEISDQEGYVLGEYNDKGIFQPSNERRKIDVAAAKRSIAKHTLRM